MNYVRRIWFRIAAVTFTLAILNYFKLGTDSTIFREQSISALLSITVIFAITSAFSLALHFNYVRGLRFQFLNQLRSVRKKIWDFYEETQQYTDPKIQDLIHKHIVPLLQFSKTDWFEFNEVKSWSKGIDKSVDDIKSGNEKNIILFKHLLPLEEEVNELGLLFIRSIVSPVLIKLTTGVFSLIAIAISIIFFGKILPYGTIQNIILANSAIIACCYAVLELLHILSYLKQEAKEELFHDQREEEKEIEET